MDAANLTEKYILWSNILDLRSRGINIARTARRLGVSRNTVRHLQSLSLEEVLQHKERHYKLHAYEQAVASLLTSFPSISSSRIGDYLRERLREDRPQLCPVRPEEAPYSSGQIITGPILPRSGSPVRHIHNS
jgi:DNA-binding CsgD family transcriptional regulator